VRRLLEDVRTDDEWGEHEVRFMPAICNLGSHPSCLVSAGLLELILAIEARADPIAVEPDLDAEAVRGREVIKEFTQNLKRAFGMHFDVVRDLACCIVCIVVRVLVESFAICDNLNRETRNVVEDGHVVACRVMEFRSGGRMERE
jgi:hypothetical protein